MKYRIIQFDYGDLKAKMYGAMYKKHWWCVWRGFESDCIIKTFDKESVAKFYSPEDALDSLKEKLEIIANEKKYPIISIYEETKPMKQR